MCPSGQLVPHHLPRRSDPPVPATCATVVHLISAHEVDQVGGMTLVAVCGELVAGASCPRGCDCDHRYCPECVRAAIRWSAQTADRHG